MKRGHLQRRACRGRTIAWARVPVMVGGQLVGVEYRLFARVSATGVSLMESRTFPLEQLASARPNARTVIAHVVQGMRAQLRWRRDQLDFQLLGLEDTTPAPAVAA
jgi:hypothetical protein